MDVNVAELESVARDLKRYADDINDMKAKLHDVSGNVENVWQSQYTGSYIDSLDNTEKRLDKLSGDVVSVSNRLDSLARQIREMEERLRRQMANQNG